MLWERLRRSCLDLLGVPACAIRLAHVCWGLDGRDEFEDDVGDADDADDAARNLLEDHVTQQQAAEKDVD